MYLISNYFVGYESSVDVLLLAVGAALSLYIAALLLPDFYFIGVRARSVLARWRQAGAATLEPQAPLPYVAVQLAIYNEPLSAVGAIRSLAALDWPHDRLDLMVLDDSTDETTACIEREIDRLRAQGVPVRHVRRSNRHEYKAGALGEALRWTDAQFVAVFDADYRPPADFLRRMVAELQRNPGAGFAQARLTYRNRDENWLTRGQAIELDMYADYEQLARAEAGLPWFFNGTCGVWRRAVIDDAGGWSGRSLVEDQDLSYRAFAAGWTGVRVDTLLIAGELPSTFRALRCQRQRWAAGSAQMLRLLPDAVSRKLTPFGGSVLRLHVLAHATQFCAIAGFALLTAAAALAGAQSVLPLAGLLAATVTTFFWTKNIGAGLAAVHAGARIDRRFAVDLASMWCVELSLLASNARAQLKGLFWQHLKFKRTPKLGHPSEVAGSSDVMLGGLPQATPSSAVALALLSAPQLPTMRDTGRADAVPGTIYARSEPRIALHPGE